MTMNTTAQSPSTPIRKLSEVIRDFVVIIQTLDTQKISINHVLDHFHERGIGFILIFFAAPMALPLPVPPGINVLLAMPLLILTAHQLCGAKRIYMPQKIRQKEVSKDKILSLSEALVKALTKLEVLIKPRLGWITTDRWSQFFGLLAFIMALTVCIPVPLTNTVPSFGITLIAIGFMMRDGLAVLTGALIGTAWVAMLAAAVIIFGPEAFEIIKKTIKSFL